MTILKILTSWSIVILILGWRIIDLFSVKAKFTGVYLNLPLNINWNNIDAFTSVITTIIAIIALFLTYKAGVFDRTPSVVASGTSIISTKPKANTDRDKAIKEELFHTFQLINVGKGVAKNVIPSVREDIEGNFLEDINPHVYALPPNKSTRDSGEILRVHGQRFVKNDKYKLEFEEDKTAFFYIHFEDYSTKKYITKVKIRKVQKADGEVEELRIKEGIEIWKVDDNIVEKIG